jgi:hypothetical protein
MPKSKPKNRLRTGISPWEPPANWGGNRGGNGCEPPGNRLCWNPPYPPAGSKAGKRALEAPAGLHRGAAAEVTLHSVNGATGQMCGKWK